MLHHAEPGAAACGLGFRVHAHGSGLIPDSNCLHRFGFRDQGLRIECVSARVARAQRLQWFSVRLAMNKTEKQLLCNHSI